MTRLRVKFHKGIDNVFRCRCAVSADVAAGFRGGAVLQKMIHCRMAGFFVVQTDRDAGADKRFDNFRLLAYAVFTGQ